MTARQLVRLYPRAWRHRYGDEFVAVIGDRQLSVQQTIDIVSGAVDAWISPSLRASVRGSADGSTSIDGRGAAAMLQELKMKCATTSPRYTTRDGMISAGMLLLTTLILTGAGMLAKREGHDQLAEATLGLAVPASLILSSPFMYLKGQSWRVQAFFVIVPLTILIAIGLLNTRF